MTPVMTQKNIASNSYEYLEICRNPRGFGYILWLNLWLHFSRNNKDGDKEDYDVKLDAFLAGGGGFQQ